MHTIPVHCRHLLAKTIEMIVALYMGSTDVAIVRALCKDPVMLGKSPGTNNSTDINNPPRTNESSRTQRAI